MDALTLYHIIIKWLVGGLNYLLCKLTIDSINHENLDPADKEKGPSSIGLMTFSTFVSLFLVAVPLFITERRAARAAGKKGALYTGVTSAILAGAGLFELTAVVLSMYGNKILDASMLVFMKATRVLWSALLSKFVLKRTLHGHHWVGVALTFIGLAPIIIVTKMVKKSSSSDQGIAFLAVFCCEFFRALRIVIEEKMMKEKGVSPGYVQYIEGAAGLLVSIAVLCGMQYKGYEYTFASGANLGSVDYLRANKYIMALFIGHTIFHGLVNYSSTVVTKLLSSVYNAIISEARIIVVWIPEFLIYIGYRYCLNKTDPTGVANGTRKIYGKEWNNLYLLDWVGFAVIVASVAVYSGYLRLPFDALYPAEEAKEDKAVSPSTHDGQEAKVETA